MGDEVVYVSRQGSPNDHHLHLHVLYLFFHLKEALWLFFRNTNQFSLLRELGRGPARFQNILVVVHFVGLVPRTVHVDSGRL